MEVINGIQYNTFLHVFSGIERRVHIVSYTQSVNPDLTLLISKSSEAVNPSQPYNHIGEGATMDDIIKSQSGIRFIINAGFSHYRKNFYSWKHQDFNIGDPVGIIKIRHHFFKDYIKLDHYGFLVQSTKESDWTICDHSQVDMNSKYILGCTPLLILNSKPLSIPLEEMVPVSSNEINPPSFLGHGLENHPRTAVGVKGNTLYFINVENNEYNSGGCSLLDLQSLGIFLELESLLNLDGGGSAQFQLYTDKETILNYVNDVDLKRILGHVLIIFDEKLKSS